MTCPQCGATTDLPTANFCEECGAALTAAAAPPNPAPCEGCGAGAELADPAGFCSRCGVERRVSSSRDHLEIVVSPRFAGVSDRGRKHHRNEDFFALGETGELRLAVVCDGVSNSRDPDVASAAAAPAIRDALLAAGAQPTPDPESTMREALNAAHAAVRAVPKTAPPTAYEMPACTAVAALLRGREVVLGWLGDSRAYFLGADNTSRLLTKDHSWLNEVVDAGVLSLEEARGRRGAHTITRTLGGIPADPDMGEDEPSVERFDLPGPGFLLLCSDGLWNYVEDPLALAAFARPEDQADAPALARRLVEHAIAAGGRDNITVVVLVVS